MDVGGGGAGDLGPVAGGHEGADALVVPETLAVESVEAQPEREQEYERQTGPDYALARPRPSRFGWCH